MKTGTLKQLLDRSFSEEEQREIEAEALGIVIESRLGELRDMLGLSQRDLAKLIDVSQPQVCKWETTGDMLISSLRRVVEALGGEIRIQARVPDHFDQWITLTDFEHDEEDRRSDHER